MAPKAKKGKAKKASDGEDEDGPSKRELAKERDDEYREQVVEMREEDPPRKWKEIAEELSIQETKALMLYTEAKVKSSDRIKPDDLTPELVTELRDEEGLAWHVIAARAGFSTVGPIKKAYEEANGEGSATGRISKDEDEKPKAKKGKKGKGRKATPSE
jgi:hypothetical protein